MLAKSAERSQADPLCPRGVLSSPILDLSVEMTEIFAISGGRDGIASALDRDRSLRAPMRKR